MDILKNKNFSPWKISGTSVLNNVQESAHIQAMKAMEEEKEKENKTNEKNKWKHTKQK